MCMIFCLSLQAVQQISGHKVLHVWPCDNLDPQPSKSNLHHQSKFGEISVHCVLTYYARNSDRLCETIMFLLMSVDGGGIKMVKVNFCIFTFASSLLVFNMIYTVNLVSMLQWCSWGECGGHRSPKYFWEDIIIQNLVSPDGVSGLQNALKYVCSWGLQQGAYSALRPPSGLKGFYF